MIFGADTQNKNLRDAASKTVDTSGRTETSNKYAAKIASSKNTSVGSDESGSPSVEHSKKPVQSDQIKGSFEGYMNGSAAHIQMNNSGYLNTSLQTARNNKEFASHSSGQMGSSFENPFNRSIMNNTSGFYQKGSSAQIVTEINKRNNLK
jgi:hypothetical protein